MRKYCHRCAGLVEMGHRHKVDRTASQRRAKYDARWARVSADFRAAFPICQWHEGCIRPSQHVHHLDGNPEGERRYDWGNLQGLCQGHHAQMTAEQQPGGWNAPDYVRTFDESE